MIGIRASRLPPLGVAIRLADMDKARIDLCVIFPSHATSYVTLRDAGFESALQHAYHRYVAN